MRVRVLALGSQGDIYPCIAFAAALRDIGHDVRIITADLYEDTIRARDVDFASSGIDPVRFMRSASAQNWLKSGASPIRFHQQLRRSGLPLLSEALRHVWPACQDAEVLVVSPLAFYAGYHIADKLQIPLVRAFYVPVLTHARVSGRHRSGRLRPGRAAQSLDAPRRPSSALVGNPGRCEPGAPSRTQPSAIALERTVWRRHCSRREAALRLQPTRDAAAR